MIQQGQLKPYAVTPRQWGRFLFRIFDICVKKIFTEYPEGIHKDTIQVQEG